MKIRKLETGEKLNTRKLYEEVFSEDSKDFVDYYYEEKVKDKPHNRQEKQDEYPSHSLDRIPIVKNDNDNRTDNGSEIEYIKSHSCYLTHYIVPINHRNLLLYRATEQQI